MNENQKYYTLVTDIGTAAISNAAMLGEAVITNTFAVGDGGGSYYQPTADMTQLVHEVWRGRVKSSKIDSDSPNVRIIECAIPAQVGGWTIREVGIFDDKGRMIAVCNTPDRIKPRITDGAMDEMLIRLKLAVSNQEPLQIEVDPNLIFLSQKDLEKHNLDPDAHSILFQKLLEQIQEALIEDIDCGYFTDMQSWRGDIDCGYFTDKELLTIAGNFLVGQYLVGQTRGG